MKEYNIYSGFFLNVRNWYFRKIIHKYTKPSDMILEVGCGQGDFLAECLSAHKKAVGLDSSRQWVKFCFDRGLSVLQGDSVALPFKDNSFDILFCHSVIEHVPHEQTMKELHRVTKPEGLLILSAPTPADSFWDDPTHVRPFTPKSLKTLLQAFGFTVQKCNYVWSELLGLAIAWSFIYRILNLFPFALGSNIVCIGRKKQER
jgi:ubiquinone/menaquinone biosynthesis C-methylase UbiE